MKKFIYQFEAMSTNCKLIIYEQKKSKADSVAEAILLETKRLEKKYNYYDKDSYLSQLNSRTTSHLDQESKTLLSRAKQYYKLTGGIFDITVATIKDLYAQEQSINSLELKKEALMPYVGCEHFSLKREKIVFDNQYTKIDLGGFVKEYAVDRAVVILKKNKIVCALVNYGGDIYALGKKPDGSSFKIGIKNPLNPQNNATEIELYNEALTTSASYERNYSIGSKIYSHIISKEEHKNKAKSVSIVSHNCVESGVYTTTLMIDKSIDTKYKTIFL